MDKKYELTEENTGCFGGIDYNTKTIKDFDEVRKDELGGFMESEKNLSYEGNYRLYDDAKVYDDAKFYDAML